MQDGATMATQPTDTAKPRPRTASDELTVIAQRAQAFTNASGTAIALSEGNVDEIICRARSGSAAPEVGTALRVEGSFTGLCIQSGKELRCDDAETDTRVDMAAIRALGIRSMVVTPIRQDSKVIGVLACFAPTAHAFTITHVAVLKTMADQITVLLQKERRSREEAPAPAVSAPAPPAPAAPKIAVAQPASAPPPSTPPPSTPVAPVMIKPATANSRNAVARSSFPVVSKVEPASPLPETKKEEKKPDIRASFGTFDAVAAGDKKSALNTKVLGAIAVFVVIAAIATFAFVKMRKPGVPVPAQNAQEQANPSTTTEPAQPQPAEQSQATTPTAPVPVSASGNSASQPVAVNTASHVAAKSTAASVSPSTKRKSDQAAEHSTVTEPPEKPAPVTVALSSGPSQIKANTSQQGADVTPTLSIVPGNAPSSLSSLANPVSSAPKAVLARSEFKPLKVLKKVPPVYPALARFRRLSGQVEVQVTVGKDGKAHNPKLISGQAMFRDAAFDAVKQWLFQPAELNGQAVEQTTRIKIQFNP